MNILLLSTSARGHAIADAFHRSSHRPSILSLSPQVNPGIEQIADECRTLDVCDPQAVVNAVANTSIDFAFIGPEDPLAAGVADALQEVGIPVVGPTKDHAQIEASKGFTRNLLTKYGIDASPKYRVFTHENKGELHCYIEAELGGEYVVKYDALLGGKGVKLSGEHLDTIADGVSYAEQCIDECGRVVIEEKLIGVEFSLISFVSGTQVIDCPVVQDHKRAYNGDTGPNTGGMGTYSDSNHSLPFLSQADIERASELNKLTAQALQKELGSPYKGILYGGFIAVRDGVRLIEYNARFGDPEVLNILPLLTSDFVDICQAITQGKLADNLVSFENKATVCCYVTPNTYPESKERRGEEFTLPQLPDSARVFYGDCTRGSNGALCLGGSRTAGIVGLGNTISQAQQVVESICSQVQGPVRYRSDIGTKALIDKRIEVMEQLRL